jgi:RNase adaptor protein for sRNA GlmZ degradation
MSIHDFHYLVTQNDIDKVKEYHEKNQPKDKTRAIALAIGWNAIECFEFLRKHGYEIDEDAIVEAQVSPNPIYLRKLHPIKPPDFYQVYNKTLQY